jgi:hypothetical protein
MHISSVFMCASHKSKISSVLSIVEEDFDLSILQIKCYIIYCRHREG